MKKLILTITAVVCFVGCGKKDPAVNIVDYNGAWTDGCTQLGPLSSKTTYSFSGASLAVVSKFFSDKICSAETSDTTITYAVSLGEMSKAVGGARDINLTVKRSSTCSPGCTVNTPNQVGQTSLGIYQVNVDTLYSAFTSIGTPSEDARPTRFTSFILTRPKAN